MRVEKIWDEVADLAGQVGWGSLVMVLGLLVWGVYLFFRYGLYLGLKMVSEGLGVVLRRKKFIQIIGLLLVIGGCWWCFNEFSEKRAYYWSFRLAAGWIVLVFLLVLLDNFKRKLLDPLRGKAFKKSRIAKRGRKRHIPKTVKDKVWKRDKGRCVRCGSKESLEYDHIFPYSKGGAHKVSNLQLLCQGCNRRKSDKL